MIRNRTTGHDTFRNSTLELFVGANTFGIDWATGVGFEGREKTWLLRELAELLYLFIDDLLTAHAGRD